VWVIWRISFAEFTDCSFLTSFLLSLFISTDRRHCSLLIAFFQSPYVVESMGSDNSQKQDDVGQIAWLCVTPCCTVLCSLSHSRTDRNQSLLAFKSPAFELEAPTYFRGRNEEEFRILNCTSATVEAALASEQRSNHAAGLTQETDSYLAEDADFDFETTNLRSYHKKPCCLVAPRLKELRALEGRGSKHAG
jgi:hypothetical protein